MGTNQLREKKYLPIRIPIQRGLLGYRVFLIHKDNVALFKSISEPNSLKKLVQISKIVLKAKLNSIYTGYNLLSKTNIFISLQPHHLFKQEL